MTEVKSLPISSIVESKTNPRRHFDEKTLKELAASIKSTNGVLNPILVRQVNGKYEIVAGARRFRASKLAGITEILASVRDLSDEKVLEIQVVENLQREDVHPLDEAEGYDQLMKKHGYDVETVAKVASKSTSYVYQRLKLAELIPPAKKLFYNEVITAGHAILIARLQQDQQKRVLKELFDYKWLEQERDLPGPNILTNKTSGHSEERRIKRTVSVRELDSWIRLNLMLDLTSAVFVKDDADLLPKAGPCTSCPKRSLNQPALFADLGKTDACTDPSCFSEKYEAHLARTRMQLEDEGVKFVEVSRDNYRKKGGVLSYYDFRAATKDDVKSGKSVKALVVDGADKGHVVDVVLPKKEKGGTESNGASDRYAAQARAAARRTKKEQFRRQLIMRALAKKTTKRLTIPQLQHIVKIFFGDIGADQQVALMRSLGFEKEGATYHQEAPFARKVLAQAKSEEQLHGLLYLISLSNELDPRSYRGGNGANLLAAAKAYRVDFKPINEAVNKKFPDKRAKPKKKLQTSAKAKKPTKKKAGKKKQRK